MDNDRKLVERMRRGDTEAFSTFIDRYGDRVLRLARRYTATEADAEDVTQEVFIALYRGIHQFRGESQLSTFVYRVAVNRCRKHHQQNLRHVSEPLPETAHSAIGDPYGYALQCEAADQIGVALNTLSEMHREVVVLHELHGLTYAECANVLNVPVGTVKSRLSNAFRHLRQRLSSYVEERQPTPVVRPAKEVRHEPV